MSLLNEMENDPLLTPDEVAEIFRQKPKTVVHWARKGLLPCVKTPGNQHRFRRSAVYQAYRDGIDGD